MFIVSQKSIVTRIQQQGGTNMKKNQQTQEYSSFSMEEQFFLSKLEVQRVYQRFH